MSDKKFIFTIEVDVGDIQKDWKSYQERNLSPLVKLLKQALLRVLPPSTQPSKNAVYTAKNSEFSKKNTFEYAAPEERGEGYVKCANPSCNKGENGQPAYFPYLKRGNQVKRYCTSKGIGNCKDEHNNAKKINKNEVAAQLED